MSRLGWVEPELKFRDDPVRPVDRHLLCEVEGCDGEMIAEHGMTNAMGTSWLHRCEKCGAEIWADDSYPCITYLRG